MRRLLLACLVAAGGLPPPGACADGEASPAARVAQLLPPDLPPREIEAAVHRLLASPADVASLVALAGRLADLGGPGACHGLAALLGHHAEPVRIAALQATAAVRLRAAALREAVLARIGESAPGDREFLPALAALAWVGDGRDVPVLLARAEEGDLRVAAEASRAFRLLTRCGASGGEAGRRRAWWNRVSAQAESELGHAWEGLADSPEGPDAALHRHVIGRRGWVLLPDTQAWLGEWLGGPSVPLRIEAARLAAALRLGDLYREIQFACQVSPPDAAARIGEALEALGVPGIEGARRSGA